MVTKKIGAGREYTRRRFGASAIGLGGALLGTSVGLSETAQAASEYYVAPDGSDGNDGTEDDPFATLDPVANNGSDEAENATVWLEDGTYEFDDDVLFYKQDGVRIRAVNRGEAVLDFSGDSGDAQSAPALKIARSEGNLIDGVVVKNAPGMGIRAIFCTDPEIRYCEVTNCGNNGITVSHGEGGHIHHCESWGNFGARPEDSDTQSGVGGAADGIGTTATKGGTPHKGVLIEYNDVHHNSDDGIDTIRTNDIVVRFNRVYANGFEPETGDPYEGTGLGSGIKLGYYDQDGGPAKCHHNVVAYNGGAGTHYRWPDDPAAIYNNTYYRNGLLEERAGWMDAEQDFVLNDTDSKNTVENCVGRPDRMGSVSTIGNSWQVLDSYANDSWFRSTAVDGRGNPVDPARFLVPTADSSLLREDTVIGAIDPASDRRPGIGGESGSDDNDEESGSEPGTEYDHTIVIDGTDGETNYGFRVDTTTNGTAAAIEKSTTRGATTNPNDEIEERSDGEYVASGLVNGGLDAYDFNGDIAAFELTKTSGTVRVYLDGQEVGPDSLGRTRPPKELRLQAAGERTTYEFTVSGDLQAAEKFDDDGTDGIDGSTGSGRVVGDGVDDFYFGGEIVDFSRDGPIRVFVDGNEVDLAPLASYENVITFDGRDGRGPYELTVSGEIAKSEANGASINSNDTIDGRTATGQVNGGQDSYEFDGEVESISADPSITVRLNGSEYEIGRRVEVVRAPDSSNSVNYIIESNGTFETSEGGDESAGSKAAGTVTDETDTYRLRDGEITDVSTFGGDVIVAVDGSEWQG
jgi:hypothetical protein